MKRILTIITALLLCQAVQAVPLAHTTASSLNVRVEPEGPVMVSLPRYTVVGVMETQGDWTKIMYFPDSDPAAKHGWVSTNYLRAIKKAQPKEQAPTVTNNTALAN